MSSIVVFCGYKGSGKTEAAKVLRQGYGYHVIKLAEPLKAMAKTLLKYLDINEFAINEYINGSCKETPLRSLHVTPRYLMQTLGTEWGRNLINPDIWTEIAQNRIQDLVNSRNDVVVDDIRFPNELDMVKEFAGRHKVVTVWVHNPRVGCDDTHASETSISQSDCDVVIRSDELSKFRRDIEEFGRYGTFPAEIVIGGTPPEANSTQYVGVY